jgi:hypothetical protein
MKPTGSPPMWLSALPVAGWVRGSSDLCSASVAVILAPGNGVMVPREGGTWTPRYRNAELAATTER